MTSERGAKTPETTGTGQDLATVSARFVALVIDWTATVLLAYGLNWAGLLSDDPFVFNLEIALLFLVYYTCCMGLRTQSLGMALMKIACVSTADGGRLGFARAFVRALLLSLLLPALTAFVHPYSRGLHDLAAGSVVLKAPAE
ncbi:RDD family protein [Glycomyces terrestris]|uniref:RDD family protein n=1 Tax=Glycomyces terrestris TaxID=2493553 RepID=A0A426V523_9ACTN|nr:RDD family protein [Glycomyces terrestris]RRS02009.1 RDD family protein [Glycomyces terrestris]